MIIRPETQKDIKAIHQINVAAFPAHDEANLVDALRKTSSPIISLVAEEDGTVIGHILFAPVTLSTDLNLKLMGLSPMAVLPQHQNKGIGSKLVN